ncbi:fructose-bisphosphate aldolase [Pseudomonas mediterranea]|uniref:Fructose-bisphosphate aldolase n=1 Tax=Pseudomonas mediterranea TaxID=183795 RepID=A0AAX2D7G0_9PSED|nr:fructose-bisphosphate aldolase [Pseudomonas mediterranea]KGU83641.1 fructose-bisphosphate aldolase [Pseudomonas mediterranea CFBP 5447]MBL0842530.1 fructose-bisphosphate aldolase [Pseudomonas mediterranea]MDU9029073.1 fructose-bisphosphate aldolase [Pseudomonas mediterranea]QHA84913.1 fructose-bisphosphate aldolase [Pseudomonas mediterranea]UZE00644.1 fructose-bisphosphate aldolase [Pseudomonas mediterranea]
MTTNQTFSRFTPLTPIATTEPVLFIDSTASLPELHACASERLHATLDYLTLMACATLRDSAAGDFNTLTNVARILVQDVTDVFGVIERRGLEGK